MKDVLCLENITLSVSFSLLCCLLLLQPAENVTYCDLHYPVDEEKPDEWYWGNFYLNPEEGEIEGKSGTELEALMHEQ